VKLGSSNRRGFLRLLGVSPIAAKAAVDNEVARAVGVTIENAAPAVAYSFGGGPAPIQAKDYVERKIAAADYARIFGLPDFVRDTMWRSSTYVGSLDPDIAAMRSWSMSVKILTQRERNLARSIEAIQHSAWHGRATSAFKTVTGWEWPW
jgi:hypothetical protein